MDLKSDLTMAIYVLIRKLEESVDHVTYEFGPNESDVGLIRIAKETGVTEVVTEVPGGEGLSYAACASSKLRKHWREGPLPDKTCFAS